VPTATLTPPDQVAPAAPRRSPVRVGGEHAATDVRLHWTLRAQIAATLLGGTLLVCSLIAGWLWRQPFFAAVPALLAVLLLGGPLVVA